MNLNVYIIFTTRRARLKHVNNQIIPQSNEIKSRYVSGLSINTAKIYLFQAKTWNQAQ